MSAPLPTLTNSYLDGLMERYFPLVEYTASETIKPRSVTLTVKNADPDEILYLLKSKIPAFCGIDVKKELTPSAAV